MVVLGYLSLSIYYKTQVNIYFTFNLSLDVFLVRAEIWLRDRPETPGRLK